MATPFLRALRSRFQSASITLYCRSYVAEVFKRSALFDSLVGCDARSALERISALRKSVPRSGYDACFVLPPSFSAAFVCFFSRAPRRIGYGSECRGALLTNALPAALYRATHLSKAYLRLLEAMTGQVETETPLPVVVPPDSWKETALRVSGGRNYFVLAQGAAYGPSKVWPQERFAEIAARLAARTGWMPVMVGKAEERAGASVVLEAAGVEGKNCSGELSVEELVSVLRGSGLTIGNDSGPAHISAALGRPTVAIFGPSSAAWTAPRGPVVHIAAGWAECAPCFKRECPQGEPACLRQVDVEDVFRAACSLIEGVHGEKT